MTLPGDDKRILRQVQMNNSSKPNEGLICFKFAADKVTA